MALPANTSAPDARKPAEEALRVKDRVIRDLEIRGGQPTLSGTRMAVHDVVSYARHYEGDLTRFLTDFPDLTRDHILVALTYYALHTEEIEAILERRRAA